MADMTLDYYNKNAETFALDTSGVAFAPIQNRFLSFLKDKAKILDLGCGVGRDALCFLSKGYDVVLIDGSVELCKIAEEKTGRKVRQLLFSKLDYTNEFDAVWACSSLLHVPSKELGKIFSLIHRALKDRGIFYCSFKYGDFEGIRNGRYFTDLRQETLSLYTNNLFKELDIWQSNDARPGRENEIWLNAILEKRDDRQCIHRS